MLFFCFLSLGLMTLNLDLLRLVENVTEPKWRKHFLCHSLRGNEKPQHLFLVVIQQPGNKYATEASFFLVFVKTKLFIIIWSGNTYSLAEQGMLSLPSCVNSIPSCVNLVLFSLWRINSKFQCHTWGKGTRGAPSRQLQMSRVCGGVGQGDRERGQEGFESILYHHHGKVLILRVKFNAGITVHASSVETKWPVAHDCM